MNVRSDSDLEEAIRSAMQSLAPSPSPVFLDRTLDLVAETPQDPRPNRSRLGLLARWGWATGSVVLVAGLATGIVIGISALAPTSYEPPGASNAPPSSVTSPPTATPAHAPSADAVQPPLPPGTWERLDLPDPAPGVLAFSQSVDVVAHHGRYVAVGSLGASCVSDIHEPPPGCDAALQDLPSTEAAVVWLSDDGRTWELVPHEAVFDGGRMQYAASDGNRIVVSGLSGGGRSIWISDDGRTWELVGPGNVLPEQLVATTQGFIGVRPTDVGPQFLASDDGSTWRALSNPGEHGAGEVMGMAVGIDGTTVVAVGVTYDYSDDGELQTITGRSWLSRDGRAWERAPANEGHEGAWMSAAVEGDNGWVAVGLDQTVDEEPADEMAAWTSPDGLRWTRVPTASIDRAMDGYADDVAWDGDRLVASGTVAGDSGSVVAFWLSTDGTAWEAVSGQPALDDGTPLRTLALDGWVLTVGARVTAPDHWIGVVWLASP